MVPPEPPLKPDRPTPASVYESESSIEFPANTEILDDKDLKELLQATNQLQDYVKRFNDGKINDAILLAEKWMVEGESIKKRSLSLAKRKEVLRKDLDSYKRLEFQYMSKWQELDRIVKDKFSDEALKSNLRQRIVNLDKRSMDLVANTDISDETVDSFLDEYTGLRKEYHLRVEKLATWEKQDMLRDP